MKLLLFLSVSLIILLVGFTIVRPSSNSVIDRDAYDKVIQKKRFNSISCSPDWSTYRLTADDVQQMIPLPGTGTHSWKISTNNDSAQFYFNQGINLYYGFHIIEALPSFKKAQTFDPSCAMLYWAEALAYGPNINDAEYSASPDALTAINKAKDFLENATSKETDFINAMDAHYSADSTIKRAVLNRNYADKMKALYMKYPSDAEVGALYADALMNLHPWDLWQHNGQPKPWTPEIRSVLENVLKNSPGHPGANHYYIHTMEASPYASKATASAELLGKLAPGLSHIVHMPSHIFIRTGQYDKGVKVNEAAIKTYYNYKELYPDVVNNAFIYDYNNRHMQAACSMNTDDYSQAINDANECRSAIDTSALSMDAPFGNYLQYMYMTPELTMVTFEKWNEILQQPDMDSRYHFAALIQAFAKGMAYAYTNDIAKAKLSLIKVESLLQEPDMAIVLSPFNAPKTPGNVAKFILQGTIPEKENKRPEAMKYYKLGSQLKIH